ncbi:MAG TPA: FecR family protein [Flavobacteriaceae bacterium]
MAPKIETIIVNYLTNQASASELDELANWLNSKTNEQLFKTYIKTNHLIDYNMLQFDADHTKKQLLDMIHKEKKVLKMRSFNKRSKYAAAAILIIALASTYFLRDTIFNSNSETITPIIVNNQIEPGIDKATLTLEDGTQVTLEKGTAYQTQNATSNGEEIVYKDGRRKTEDGRRENRDELVYNTLTIPRGGQFQMTLSDGTKVWLNSETQLKYPVSFTDGESRRVELVYGEAYFEVSPSTENRGSDFKVHHDQQEVQVLGTAFNIKAYKDETHIYTTLAEGNVAVNFNGKTQLLSPGEQSVLDGNTNNITINKVNVNIETAWKEGIFNFIQGKSLKEIMAVLSRWYDFDVVFENESLESVRFKGILGKNQNVEEILSAIKSTSINNYEINNKTIILK